MLLWLLNSLSPSLGSALAKITFRAALAATLSFGLALVLGPWLIAWLNRRFLEPIVSPSPTLRDLHKHKQSTPTMGGLFIVAGLVIATALLADMANAYVVTAIVATLGLAAVGMLDDLTKLRTKAAGISARTKLCGQTVIALGAAVTIYWLHRSISDGLTLVVPLAHWSLNLGWLFIPLATVVIVGSSNAVNLTDGLDGLAGGCIVSSLAALAVLAYVSGHAELASYLNVPHLPESGELVVVLGATLGGVLGFLWFNCHPAQVFMGDTGSLPLGGIMGLVAVIIRQELLLVILASVFVAEAGSVILQVWWHRRTGRRIFRCAPLHHHFQFCGWPESRIVVRFWIVSALSALAALAVVKFNIRELPPSAAIAKHDSMLIRR